MIFIYVYCENKNPPGFDIQTDCDGVYCLVFDKYLPIWFRHDEEHKPDYEFVFTPNQIHGILFLLDAHRL